MIRVSETQRNNTVIKYIRKAKVLFTSILYDYEPGGSIGILFLSFRVHLDSPSYLYKRIEGVKSSKEKEKKCVILLLIDVELNIPRNRNVLGALQMECLSFKAQVLPVSTALEAAKYVETIHLYSNTGTAKGKEALRNYKRTVQKQEMELERTTGTSPTLPIYARKTLFLSAIPKITVRDAKSLLSSFSSLNQIAKASHTPSLSIKGIGKIKYSSIHAFLTASFDTLK